MLLGRSADGSRRSPRSGARNASSANWKGEPRRKNEIWWFGSSPGERDMLVGRLNRSPNRDRMIAILGADDPELADRIQRVSAKSQGQ